MSTVTCANCNAKNTEGSKFCNHCGAALPLSTHITCPTCETRNPRTLMYCDNCGTRLLPTGELSSEKEEEKPVPPKSREAPKAFSLPARDPGEEMDPNRLFDWLRTGEEQPEGESGQEPTQDVQRPTEEQENVLGGWLDELSDIEAPAEEPTNEGGISDWLSELDDLDENDTGTADIENTVPDWLEELNLEDSPDESQADDEETLADWFSSFEAEDEEPDQPSDLPKTDILVPRDPSPEDFEKVLRGPNPFPDDNDDDFSDWLSEFEEEGETSEKGEEADLADWLSDFDTDAETPTLIEAVEFADEDETPTLIESAVPAEYEDNEEVVSDWLSDFGDDDDTPTLIGSFESSDEDEALPDWLSGGDEEPAAPESAVSTDTEQDDALPDWLSGGDDGDDTATMISSFGAAEDEGELPDWLSGGEEQVAAETADEDEAFPDWLSETESVESAVSTEEEDEELPDWLDDFDSEQDTPTLVMSSEPAEEAEEISDWFSDLDSIEETTEPLQTAESSREDEEIADWLADFSDETDTPTLLGSTESLSDELPDWLNDFEDEQDDEFESVSETAETEEPTDWLDSLDEGDDSLFDLDSPETAEEEGMPDWLDSLGEGDDSLFDLDSAETAEEEGMPDWLSEMRTEDISQASASDEADELDDIFADFNTADMAPVDELPDWMSDVTPETAEEVTAEALPVDELESDDDGMPDWLSDFPDEDETFDVDEDTDWFEALNQEEAWPEAVDDEGLAAQLEPPEPDKETADPIAPSQELKGVPKELVSSSLPDWLTEEMPQMSSSEEDEDQIPQGELPAWLQQMRPSELSSGNEGLGLGEGLPLGDTQDEWQNIFENMPSADRGFGPGSSDLSAAEIPAWLQALKPTSTSEEPEMPLIDEEPETEGPLAGLRGVLQVAPYVTKPAASTSTPAYTVSKEQQQQIALLHRLTHEEQAATKQVSVKKGATFSAGGRALLGLLLLLVILAGVLLPRTDIPLPETALPVSESALATFNTVDPLVGGSVLVAFDYSPAMAAELDPIALMLLGQLAANGNRVLTISQSAAGTALAERVTADVNDLDSQSLGLLTGEAVGLRSLGSCLNSPDNCNSLFGSSVDASLQAELTNLDLVILLTSDRNSLINWIEQVESQIEAPVITAVNQPLGPLTIPYLSSGQLEGSLNGLPAASAYEKRLLGQTGGTFQQFTAQSIGMWVVIMALIVAALFYGLAGFANRNDKKGNG